MKLIVFAVLGLLVGLGGGSAFSVLKAKKAFGAQGAHQAKVVADSLAKAVEEGSHRVAAVAAPATAKDSSGAAVDSTPPGAQHALPTGAPSLSKSGAATSPPKAAMIPQTTKSLAPVARADSASTKPTVGGPAKVGATPWNRAVATVQPRATTAAPGKNGKGAAPASLANAAASLPPSSISPEKIAKIFAAMPAREAAKVLEQLDDSDVQSILGALSGKQAAAILQTFPPNRAAAISKAALRGGVTKP